jgi:hypothetical protein
MHDTVLIGNVTWKSWNFYLVITFGSVADSVLYCRALYWGLIVIIDVHAGGHILGPLFPQPVNLAWLSLRVDLCSSTVHNICERELIGIKSVAQYYTGASLSILLLKSPGDIYDKITMNCCHNVKRHGLWSFMEYYVFQNLGKLNEDWFHLHRKLRSNIYYWISRN